MQGTTAGERGGVIDIICQDSDGDVLRHYATLDVKRGDKMPGEPEYFFFDLKNFTKSEAELEGDTEKWLYLLRNSGTLESFPSSIEGESFRVFEKASRMAAYNEQEFDEYVSAMMTQRDYNSALNFAREQGVEEGIAQGLEQGLEQGMKRGKAEERALWHDTLKSQGYSDEQIEKLVQAVACASNR